MRYLVNFTFAIEGHEITDEGLVNLSKGLAELRYPETIRVIVDTDNLTDRGASMLLGAFDKIHTIKELTLILGSNLISHKIKDSIEKKIKDKNKWCKFSLSFY